MSKFRAVAVLIPVVLVLATLSFRSEPEETTTSSTPELGPSMALAQSYGLAHESRKAGDLDAVIRGTTSPRPPAAQMHLDDRPELATGSGKPNIVWFLTDDMALSDLQGMPAVRRLLGQQGTTFTNALSTDSLCCPARSTLVTGRSAHNHRTLGNGVSSVGGWKVFKRFNDTSKLVPVWMQAAGYRTWMMGKYLNGYNGNDRQPGWDYFYAPTHGIFDPFEWTAAVNGSWVHYKRSYQQSIVTRYAVQDLATFARRGEPFFMFVQSIAPHGFWPDDHWVPPIPEKKYRSTVAPMSMPQSPNLEEWDVTDKAKWVMDQPWSLLQHSYTWSRRIESLKSVDDEVSAVVEQTKRSGVYDNTIFVFMSDNGYSFGSHRYLGKNVPYEESARVPLVIAGPGFPAGRQVSQQATLEDVVATAVQASGARPAWPLDGVPLQGVVKNPEKYDDRPVLLEGSVAGIPGMDSLPVDDIGRFYEGVRWRHWKLITYATGESEFYDLARDPYELTNIYNGQRAAPSRRAEIVRVQRKLERWHAAHRNCVGWRQCTEPPR